VDTGLISNENDNRRQGGGGVIQEKWGAALKAGFQVVPNVLIRSQTRLGLDTTDVVVLLNLMSNWWAKDEHPYISPTTIAKRIKKSTRTVERHLKSLEKKGFLKRCTPKRTKEGIYIRHYDLQPMVGKLEEESKKSLELRARQPQFKSLNRTVSSPRKAGPL